MESRTDLLENKKNDIASIITETCISYCGNDQHSSEIMQNLLESKGLLITPPQEEPPTMYMITMNSLRNFNKGQSIKPGNIKLNIRLLIDSLPGITAAGVGIVLNIPILKICAALNIWKMLRDITTVKITKEQAITIVALWQNCDIHQRITLEKGFNCFSSLYKQIETSECSWEQYIKVINELEKLNSLKLDDNGIWLCEWVSKSYTK